MANRNEIILKIQALSVAEGLTQPAPEDWLTMQNANTPLQSSSVGQKENMSSSKTTESNCEEVQRVAMRPGRLLSRKNAATKVRHENPKFLKYRAGRAAHKILKKKRTLFIFSPQAPAKSSFEVGSSLLNVQKRTQFRPSAFARYKASSALRISWETSLSNWCS